MKCATTFPAWQNILPVAVVPKPVKVPVNDPVRTDKLVRMKLPPWLTMTAILPALSCPVTRADPSELVILTAPRPLMLIT